MKLLLADCQDITRAGIRHFASTIDPSVKIEDTISKNELIAHISHDTDALIVLDYTNMDFETAEDILIVQERYPNTQWLLFSSELSEAFLRKMLLTNLRTSVVMKDSKADEIEFALRSMFHKERYICHYVSNLLLNVSQKKKEEDTPLTPTETMVLKEIALGKTTKEIAAERCLSFHTVNTHRKNIFRKLEVNNVHEAIKYAMRAGLVDLAEYCI